MKVPECKHYQGALSASHRPHLGRVELAVLAPAANGDPAPRVDRAYMMLCDGCAEELRHWIYARQSEQT